MYMDALERVAEKWSEKYPNSMKSWRQNLIIVNLFVEMSFHTYQKNTFKGYIYLRFSKAQENILLLLYRKFRIIN